MSGSIFKKGLVVGIICLFIGISIIPSTGKIDVARSRTTIYDGSLLGYVNDTSGNPIEGALVMVFFHDTFRKDFSDEDGYYHVIDIPICYCLKNATCYKESYKTELVLLSIVENTTHDFILNSNNPPDKPNMPAGSIHGKIGIEYTYTTNTTEPDDDMLFYQWDWGDDSQSYWFGPYASGQQVSASHAWSQGSYEIRVKARDVHGLESTYSNPLSITMPRNKAMTYPLLFRLLERFPLLNLLLQILY